MSTLIAFGEGFSFSSKPLYTSVSGEILTADNRLYDHALKYLLFTLWGEEISKDDRIEMEKAVKQALFTMVNSTKKHLKDGDKERLKARIDTTLKELHIIADELEDRGYTKVSTFIQTTQTQVDALVNQRTKEHNKEDQRRVEIETRNVNLAK